MKIVFNKPFRISFSLICLVFTIALFFIPVLTFNESELHIVNSFYEFSYLYPEEAFQPILITRYVLAIIISLIGFLMSFKSPLGVSINFIIFYTYIIMFLDQFVILIYIYENVSINAAFIISILLAGLVALYSLLFIFKNNKGNKKYKHLTPLN